MIALFLALSLAAAPKAPVTKKVEVTDDYFGTKVADPYRWLEDDNAADTKAWVEAQNKVTSEYLESVPERERVKARLTKLWNYERYSPVTKRGGRYFFYKNDGLQNQSVLYVADALEGTPRVLIDPNSMAKDGTVALSDVIFTDDGSLAAYGVAESGSDWVTWRVRDVATGADKKDEIKWTKFTSVAWLKDGSGFYYSGFAAPKGGDELKGVVKNQKVFFHKLGTEQTADVVTFERTDKPDWMYDTEITDDGKYLLIAQRESTERKNRLYVRELGKKDAKTVAVFDAFDASYNVIGSDGDQFYVLTDKDAPRFRLVSVKAVEKSDPKQWKTLVAESVGNRDVLAAVTLVGERFATVWRTDAHEALRMYSLSGKKENDIALPTLGTVGYVHGQRKDKEAFFSFTSFTYPTSIYRYNLDKKTTSLWRQPKVDFNPADYETKQVFYPSKDGTKIPMFVTHKKGLQLDGNNPTYLYAYGGFQISLTPSFSPANLAWMEMGGVYAQPNLRGGGEYGTQWHDAGRLAKKQNVFDDFAAAAEWLVANKYTQARKLAIGGGSNGGLLVGASITQRPELFGAALPAVGVMDMLRFHKFTIGWAWKSDYGSSESKEGFEVLYKYSPLHNIKTGVAYPATLVTTGDHDDRVVPAHSHKFTATLQAAQSGDAPILTRIETKAGHGKGKPTSKQIEERADQWSFLIKTLGMKLPST
jgi:prolyl oligopeptidase